MSWSQQDFACGTSSLPYAGPDFAFPPAEVEGMIARPIAELAIAPVDIKASSEEPDAGNATTPALLLT